MKNLPLIFLILIPTTVFAAILDDNYQDSEFRTYLSQAVSDLEKQVKHINEQYVSLTSRLAKLEYDLPEKFQCLSNLFQLSNSHFSVDNDAHLFYDSYGMSELEKFYLFSEGDDRYVPNPEPSPFATLAQLIAVSNQVVALNASFTILSSNLTSLSNTVSSITASLSNSQGSLENLSIAYNRLDEICDSLTSVMKVNSDGSVVLCKSSPIVGNIEPRGNGYVYALAQNWDRCCSKFRVSTNTFLESITLYCDDPGKMPAPLDVYVQTVTQDNLTGRYAFETWSCVTVDTSNFPRCEWKFPPQYGKVPIQADRDYLLCIKKTNGALYPYLANSYRQGGFYKPIGASEVLPPEEPEDPRSSSPGRNPEMPRSNPSPQDWFDYLFLYDWEESDYSNSEIWSILKFSDDESFTFSETGLAVESGNITVAGSEVVTSLSLKDMFVSAFTNSPNITWEMFCQELQNRIITTAGGSITNRLEVTQMKFNAEADWEIGTTNICSDIVLLNENAKVRSNAGDLKLSAPEGKKISAESFISFESGGQAGIITIPAEQTEKAVSCSGITDQAVIILTPRQPISNIWWSVRSIQSNACFKVILDKTWNENLSFNYIIIRK